MEYKDDNETCEIIMRQTNYDYDTAMDKLRQYNGDVKSIVREYIGIDISSKVEKKSTVQQQLYTQIRNFLDNK